MKIKTLIVDDEPHAIEVIEQYIGNFPDFEVVATCNNALQAFRTVKSEKIDLVFLDVKMPGLTGVDFIRSLEQPPKIIFTTAYPEYAIDGFNLNAVDYLLKPVPFDRFMKAIDKVLPIFNGSPHSYEPVARPAVNGNKEQFLYLRIDRRITKINTADIYWIESFKDYIKVVLKDKVLTAKQKISVVEKLLPYNEFIRIHRSFIVPVKKIESYHSQTIQVLGKELPIGRNYKVDCQNRLNVLS